MPALESMINFLETAYGYELHTNLYTGVETLIYRALEKKTNRPVVIKIMHSEYPSTVQLKKFEREFSINRELALEGVVRTYRLLSLRKTKAIIMEDFGGVSLLQLGIAGKLQLKEFLLLALNIAGILHQVHSRGIIHKDLKPHNILMNPQTLQLKLIDFGLAAQLTKEAPYASVENPYGGTFQYMPPEQSQSLHKPIDFRSDLYALGVTFYQLLTGKLPFDYDNKEQLIHAHAARIPREPKKIRPEIPRSLSSVILKLLEKRPSRRYQSSGGLLLDLEKCLRRLLQTGTITNFLPGTHDVPMTFFIPPRLYGRETELKRAIEVYDSLENTNKKSIFIHGEPGIGKSSLARELEKEIRQKKGVFISGKFDRSKQTNPYSALLEAVTALADQLMMEPEKNFKRYKEKILLKLGPCARVICNRIPHMQIITGLLPEAPPLPPEQTKHRLHRCFQHLLSIASDFQVPLTLFLDDLQWADQASLELIQQILTNPAITNFLFIGTYRDKKPKMEKTFLNFINILKENPGSITEIPLKAPVQWDITQMLSDTFYCTHETAAPLAAVLRQKTGGNPFFTKIFLKTLYSEGRIRFNGKWIWNINKIKHQTATSNVITQLQQNIEKLDYNTKEILKIASCYGKSFNINDFSFLLNKSYEKILNYLLPAIRDGYFIMDEKEVLFVHDQIHEAAYKLIPEEMRIYLHYRIGKTINLQNQNEEMNNLFRKTTHLNNALPLLGDNEKDELLTLNIKAGKKAVAAGAFDTAEIFFKAGREMLKPDSWKSDYPRTLELLTGLAETKTALAKYNEIKNLFDEIITNSLTIEDEIKITTLYIFSLIARNEPEKALVIGLRAFKELGVSFRLTPSMTDIESLFKKVEKSVQKLTVEKISLWSFKQESRPENICRIIKALMGPLVLFTPLLFVELTLQTLNLHLIQKTFSKTAISILSSYAGIAVVFSKYDQAMALIRVFDKKQNQLYNPLEISQYLLNRIGGTFWTQTPCSIIKNYNKVLQWAIIGGDNENASKAYLYILISHLTKGTSLVETALWGSRHYQKIQMKDYKWMIGYFNLYRQGAAALLGETEKPHVLKGEYFDEESALKDPANRMNAHFHIYFGYLKILLLYLFEKYNQCTPFIENIEKNALTFASQSFYTSAILLFALVISSLPDGETDKQTKTFRLKKLEAYEAKLKFFTGSFDAIHGSKYRIIKAERYRLKNKPLKEIMGLYDKSIAEACKNECICEAAIANERAAVYLFSRNEQTRARTYLKEAVYFYSRWGCTPKVKQLQTKYDFYPKEVIKNIRL